MRKEERLLKEFEDEIKNRNRYIIKSEIIDLFNEIIMSLTEDIEKGETLYRGRVNKRMDPTPYSDEDLGMPNPKVKLTLGRVNPYGINYLYLAEDVDTVISELRPNRDSLITIGEYEVLRDIKIAKLSNWAVHSKENICNLALLLGMRFSLPVEGNNDILDYLPTQYFAELCKDNKLDGIKFLSSVMNNEPDHHYNVTLFDDTITKCKNKYVHRVFSIKYEHKVHEDIKQHEKNVR
jgi:hypothetical protein